MIIFASGRTDIPAFYSEWFINRIRAGFVDVRNPYVPQKGEYGIKIESCAEKLDLSDYGVQKGECISKELIERITNVRLSKNVHQILRKHCSCLPTRDIGYYNSCPNLCKYCYANYDEKTVQKNFLQHDKNSSFLIGNSRPNDIIQQAKQETFKDSQLFMF